MGLTYSTIDPYTADGSDAECRSCGGRFADASGLCPECGGELRDVGLPRE